MSDKRLVMALAAENNALLAENWALKDALDKATKGEYSKLELELAAGRAGQIADRFENAALKEEIAALKKQTARATDELIQTNHILDRYKDEKAVLEKEIAAKVLHDNLWELYER